MRRVLVFAIVLAAAPASADDREDARREFAAGQAADKTKDWQTAIEHYLRANDLVPHPFAIYNIAVDYDLLGQPREAATWYQRYLDAAPDSPDRTKVAKALADLKTRPAKLTVHTTPAGARVSIDGTPVGVTPYAGVTRGGTHRIAVEREGSRDEREITIEFGEPADVEITLAATAPPSGPSGTLLVAGAPLGAIVTIDGMSAGVVPATVMLPPGPHAVRVAAYGYAPSEQQANIESGQTTRVDVALVKGDGTDLATKIQIGYVLGVAGGVDTRGDGTVVLGEFGARAGQYEGLVRVGRAMNATAVDLIVRWAFLKTKLSPFLGGGYAFTSGSGGSGYTLLAGFRFDLTRGERLGLSLLADIGVRSYTATGTDGFTETKAAIPIGLSLDVIYR
jgi:hypothetical protein